MLSLNVNAFIILEKSRGSFHPMFQTGSPKRLVLLRVNSVNSLYLMVHSVTGYSKEQDENKYLILDSTDK